MTTALALAATSATLRHVLEVGMTALDVDEALGGSVTVSVGAPDRAYSDSGSDTGSSRLNLFVYNVVRNTGYTGDGLPTRDARGERIQNPVLGLDLCYLLTAYGTTEFHAEILLGGAIQVLHDTPGLGRDTIREALDPTTHPGLPAQLKDSGLADQFESLRVSPIPTPTEEISRLWSSIQSPYRPSTAYLVSVVLMQGTRSTRSAFQVKRRIFRALPFSELRIDRVITVNGADDAIDVTSTLKLVGRNLDAPDLAVWINGIDVSAGVISRAPDEIRLELRLPLPPAPPTPPPPRVPIAGLRAGIAGVEVVQSVPLGDPPVAHEGFSSNVASFVLTPHVTAALVAGRVQVTCSPPIGVAQRVQLLLNQDDALPGVTPRSFSFLAPAGNGIVAPATETGVIAFDIPGVVPGHYVVRLRVDGALSMPGIVANRFATPEITV